jgi:hypothetical protein
MAKNEEYLKFLAGQEGIYQKFRSFHFGAARTEGVKAHTLTGKGGYFVVLRHSDPVAQNVGSLSREIDTRHVPSLVYDPYNVHTTIFDYNVVLNFSPDEAILGKMVKGTENALTGARNLPRITYTSWLINSDTVIAAGVPDRRFFELVQQITCNVKAEGIEARAAWGAHITAARFREVRSSEQVQGMLKLLDETLPLGESVPIAVDVGYFQITPDVFNFQTHRRFEL